MTSQPNLHSNPASNTPFAKAKGKKAAFERHLSTGAQKPATSSSEKGICFKDFESRILVLEVQGLHLRSSVHCIGDFWQSGEPRMLHAGP